MEIIKAHKTKREHFISHNYNHHPPLARLPAPERLGITKEL